MRSLFIITRVSPPVIDLIIQKKNIGEVALVSPYPQTISYFASLGINGFLLRQKNLTISEKDRLFAEKMLPGKMEAYGNFKDEELPVWKVLSLDRLKFWFDHPASINSDFINGISADEVYVSLDMDSPYPWTYKWDLWTTAIQIGNIRTPEFYFMSSLMKFDEYIVLAEEEGEFLRSLNLDGLITNVGGKTRNGKRIIESQEREDLKKSAGLSGNITGIIFDKRDEWQARKYITDHKIVPLLFPADERSLELIPSVFHGYKYFTQPNMVLTDMCDTLVAFRWNENYFNDGIPNNFKVMDYHGMNLAKKLAPEWISVSI